MSPDIFAATFTLLAVAVSSGPETGGCSSVELSKISKLAVSHYQASRFRDAEAAFRVGASWTRACGNRKREALFLNGVAGSQFASYRYREALATYRETIRLAREAEEVEIVAVASLNVSSLYTFLWEPNAAEQSLSDAARLLPASSKYQPKLIAQRMYLAARRRHTDEAFLFGTRASSLALNAGDLNLATMVWDKLGRMSMDRGDLATAESYLLAAFRMRKLNKLPMLESSYRSLGALRLRQGRSREALTLLRAAGDTRNSSPALAAEWPSQFLLAQAMEANDEDAGALDAYRAALDHARRWRSGLISAQWMLTAADVNDAQVASAFARLAARVAEREQKPAIAREAVLAMEYGRALSLDSLVLNTAWRQDRLPQEFGDTLSELREAEMRRLRGDITAAVTVERLNGKLALMESHAGVLAAQRPSISHDEDTRFVAPRPMMGPQETHFSFLVGERESWVWALTGDSIAQHRLPGRAELEARVGRFRHSLHRGRPDWEPHARSLYALLFGWSGKPYTSRFDWTFSLDGPLFQLPLAALMEDSEAEPRFLPESHTLAVVPSLYYRAPSVPIRSRRILAVGDCVYNRADKRFSSRRPGESVLQSVLRFMFTTAEATESGMALPRLAGSATEIREVARVYQQSGYPVQLLSGTRATGRAMEEALARPAGVIHFAAHVISGKPSPSEVDVTEAMGNAAGARRPEETFIALSLGQDGRPDLLPASTVARKMRVPGSLVVLSGCSSGEARVLPGAGLQGLPRAWLAAGARGVVGSLWPVTDDSGRLFAAMYERLATGQSPREALRQAQLDQIRADGWRSRPSYWAAYMLMGKD